MQKLRTILSGSAYAYCIAALLAALLLLLFWYSSGRGTRTELEARMEETLCCIEGAGRVRVLINRREEEAAAVWNVVPSAQEKEIIGVVIVAEGAADPLVAARLAQAAGTALGVSQSCIEILRMQGK